jgi:dihydroneopterin aldolase
VLRVHLGRGVRGVEPDDVDARVEDGLHRIGRRRCRPDGRHDLGSSHFATSRSLPIGRAGATPESVTHRYLASVDRIVIAGLREMGVHGVLAEEQHRPQPFQVDIELAVDLAAAGASDVLADTVDYGAICDGVRKVVAHEHYQLLERLATHIAEVCRADPRVAGVVVEVRKLEPPVAGRIDYTGVRIER